MAGRAASNVSTRLATFVLYVQDLFLGETERHCL